MPFRDPLEDVRVLEHGETLHAIIKDRKNCEEST